MDKRTIRISIIWLLALISAPTPAFAVWLLDGVPITYVAEPLASGPSIVSDGAHGVIIAWQDSRSGSSDIYAQRVNAAGVVQWTTNGIAVCVASSDQRFPRIASDGAGGAIITWEDFRDGDYDIYAQRVNASGVAQWAADGIAVCTHAADQQSIQIVSDGTGGAVIVWEDLRAGSYDVYAQRVNGSGAIQWVGNGVAVCTALNDQRFLQAMSDGGGGAIITWQDVRGGADNDVYAQHIDSEGSPQWTANGVAVCTEAHEQHNPRFASDGAGGVIIAWEDARSGSLDIYAQRIDVGGAALWITDGIAICAAANDQESPQIVSDGGAGAIIAWEDARSTYYDRDIYAQRVDYRGTAQWAADGAVVCVKRYKQRAPRMIADGIGGAIVVWKDYDSAGLEADVCAQRINASGARQWAANGIAVGAWGSKNDPQIDSDGAGGAVIAWESYVDGSFSTIYAQRLNASGTALWNPDGVGVCVRARGQESCDVASDGAGGAIIVWVDVRSGEGDIYAQRIAADGTLQWITSGIAVCTVQAMQIQPQVLPDGTGGAFITWSDGRSGNTDIYAQRLDANGVPQWAANGVAVCTATNSQQNPRLVSDGAGGIIVTWQDIRNGVYDDIYAQRLSASGVPLWTANGVAVCAAAKFQYDPELVSDGAGGAIITWLDIRGADYDIYAQRIDASGVVQWTADGVAVCTATNSQTSPQLVSDGAGGAIITWDDYRSGAWDIYAQRFDSNGVAQWAPGGVLICAATNSQRTPQLTSDNAGGAVVTWDDERSGSSDIYAQRIDAGGATQWVTDGAAVCTASMYQVHARIVSDGASGAIIAWEDMRSGGYDLYAQRIGADGVVRWESDGLAVSAASGSQAYHQMALDGAGGAIITWEDVRSGAYSEIYAQRVMDGGLEPICSVYPSAIALEDSTRVGEARDTSFTITNDGAVPLGGNVSESCGQFSIVSGEGGFLLSSGQSLVVTVRFQPTEAGTFECVVETGIDLCSDVSITARAFLSDSVVSIDPDLCRVPRTFALYQNVPNPFNPTTTLRYDVPAGGGRVMVRVYDVAGRIVRTLVDEVEQAGWKSVRWDGTNDRGDRVASGIYFCRMSAVGYRETRKMILLR